jgi:hypothetical protein
MKEKSYLGTTFQIINENLGEKNKLIIQCYGKKVVTFLLI